jgi:hypothetical protein
MKQKWYGVVAMIRAASGCAIRQPVPQRYSPDASMALKFVGCARLMAL